MAAISPADMARHEDLVGWDDIWKSSHYDVRVFGYVAYYAVSRGLADGFVYGGDFFEGNGYLLLCQGQRVVERVTLETFGTTGWFPRCELYNWSGPRWSLECPPVRLGSPVVTEHVPPGVFVCRPTVEECKALLERALVPDYAARVLGIVLCDDLPFADLADVPELIVSFVKA
jgi:hypothetical protein